MGAHQNAARSPPTSRTPVEAGDSCATRRVTHARSTCSSPAWSLPGTSISVNHQCPRGTSSSLASRRSLMSAHHLVNEWFGDEFTQAHPWQRSRGSSVTTSSNLAGRGAIGTPTDNPCFKASLRGNVGRVGRRTNGHVVLLTVTHSQDVRVGARRRKTDTADCHEPRHLVKVRQEREHVLMGS